MDIFEIETEMKDKTNGSYSHLFVREGKIKVEAEDGSVVLSAGHSCFIPENVLTYGIKSLGAKSVVLKAYIE